MARRVRARVRSAASRERRLVVGSLSLLVEVEVGVGKEARGFDDGGVGRESRDWMAVKGSLDRLLSSSFRLVPMEAGRRRRKRSMEWRSGRKRASCQGLINGERRER